MSTHCLGAVSLKFKEAVELINLASNPFLEDQLLQEATDHISRHTKLVFQV